MDGSHDQPPARKQAADADVLRGFEVAIAQN